MGERIELECNCCGHKFSRTALLLPYLDVKCPKCKEYDIEVVGEAEE